MSSIALVALGLSPVCWEKGIGLVVVLSFTAAAALMVVPEYVLEDEEEVGFSSLEIGWSLLVLRVVLREDLVALMGLCGGVRGRTGDHVSCSAIEEGRRAEGEEGHVVVWCI